MSHNSSPTIIALAGNPNVGKSTVFNGLTGLKQKTANWPGVTVSTARGTFHVHNREYLLVDLPGIYSLSAHSQEEAIAGDYINSGEAHIILLVCDATCLERGLHLLKQILALERIRDQGIPVVLCVNLCDEAEKKGIQIDFELLRDVLQIPVIRGCARRPQFLKTIRETAAAERGKTYTYDCLDFSPRQLAAETVRYTNINYRRREELIDRIVTGPVTGMMIMIALLLGIFWLTMVGANVPSGAIWKLLFGLEPYLVSLLAFLSAPLWLVDALVYGVYRSLAWVVAVMLPPMAIFFPLFTLLEDLGYLPRVAFRMDRAFQRCRSCGKQCLTMAMGLGCNAAGVVGCRIIDSPRERLIAIITNALIPCNGRFPTLITLISLFFAANLAASSTAAGASWVGFLSAIVLTGTIVFSVAITLAASWFLSHTLLRGMPSSFTLELPPYRKPELSRILVRSILDRTLFVLGRAIMVSAPAGLVIWVLANVWFVGPGAGWFALQPLAAGAPSLLMTFTGLLEPVGLLMGLDGVILAAFLLGFPANEIVFPIILMTYLQAGYLRPMTDASFLLSVLSEQGWTWITVLCMLIFCLFHWPCSTTVLTIHKETGSLKWTAVSMLLPTIIGFTLCVVVAALGRVFGVA